MLVAFADAKKAEGKKQRKRRSLSKAKAKATKAAAKAAAAAAAATSPAAAAKRSERRELFFERCVGHALSSFPAMVSLFEAAEKEAVRSELKRVQAEERNRGREAAFEGVRAVFVRAQRTFDAGDARRAARLAARRASREEQANSVLSLFDLPSFFASAERSDEEAAAADAAFAAAAAAAAASTDAAQREHHRLRVESHNRRSKFRAKFSLMWDRC